MNKRFLSIIQPIALLPLLMMNSCAMSQLNNDMKRFENEYVNVSGTILPMDKDRQDIILVMWPVADEEESHGLYRLLDESLEFSLQLPPGDYYLIAFQDRDRNSYYTVEEPLGRLMDPEIVRIDESGANEGLVIQLAAYDESILPEEVQEFRKSAGDVDPFQWRKDLAGRQVDLNDPVFGPDVATDGYWQPLTWLEERGIVLGFLEQWDPERTPVLYVHGATGYPQEFSEIIDSLDTSRFQPWILSYPSGLHLRDSGRITSQLLEELYLRYGFEEIVVVAHSMGGLLTRHILTEYTAEQNQYKVPLYITIATPWNGVASAGKGVQYSPAVVPSWYDMVPENELILDMFRRDLPEETEHHLIFTFGGDGGGSENNDGSVTIASQLYRAAQEEAVDITGINAGHVEVLSHEHTLDMVELFMARLGD